VITSFSGNAAAATGNNSSTASGFASLQIVTASCHGVLNTQFIAPSPKPNLFGDLNARLDGARVLANQWINDIAPTLSAGMPSHRASGSITCSKFCYQLYRYRNQRAFRRESHVDVPE
jgi:hypothetical protein